MHALGFGSSQVGRSHECDTPASVLSLPCLTEPRIPVTGNSAEIDRLVRRESEHRLSLYALDAARLSLLAPTHIVTQAHCEVCAVSERDVAGALCDWQPPAGEEKPRIVSLSPEDLEGVLSSAVSLGAALGDAGAGEKAAREVRSRMNGISSKAKQARTRPRVAMIEWIEPLMVSGNWIPELVERAGGENLFGEKGKHSPELSFESLAAADPDVVVVIPCGFDLARTKTEMELAGTKQRFGSLRAAREGRLFAADGNRYFNRPGPSLATSLEILAEMLHPERLRFGHEGGAWERLHL